METPLEPAKTFEFIVIDETGKPENRLKRKVRSHSSRIGWARHARTDEGGPRQRRRRRRALEGTTFVGTEQPPPDEAQVAPKAELVSVSVPPPGLILDKQLGGGRVDPFQVYPPVRWRPIIPSLIDHYIVHMAVDIPELDQSDGTGLLRSQWFPLAVTESATFQIVLLLSASNYAVVSSSAAAQIRPHLLQMKYDAMRAINDAFSSSDRRLSDAVIGAVAKMASFEAMFGTVDAYRVHMAGLRKMVAIRGGLAALGLGGLLRRIIVWIDLNSALLLKTPRYFPGATFEGDGDGDGEEGKGFAGVEGNLERFIAI